MHAVLLIPGIMGTELLLPTSGGGQEKVWPPTPLETQLGYHRRDKLASPHAVAGGIIRNVLCFDFYKPLFDQLHKLGFTEGGADKRLIGFPYDWRLDLFDTATRLAGVIAGARAAGATRISLVAHSMGGLVARLVLEDPAYQQKPWFGAIDQLIAIATPHLGAPLALARALGQDSALGISGADFAWLAAHDAFPSAYQLLPAPGELACWNQSDPALRPLDIYDRAIAARLGLKASLLARTEAVHALLGAGNTPAHVRYFYFAATGHRTATRVNVHADGSGPIDHTRTAVTRTLDGGDGTVPMFSALPVRGQRHIAVNEHASAFTGAAFHRAFVRLLGGNEGDALEGRAGLTVKLSVEAPVVPADADIEVLLVVDAPADEAIAAIRAIEGELVVERLGDDGAVIDQEVRRVPVRYDGPPLSRLRLRLAPLEMPGLYRLRFVGAPVVGKPAVFSACAPLPTLAGPAEA